MLGYEFIGYVSDKKENGEDVLFFGRFPQKEQANAVNNDLRVVDPEHPGWASSYWWARSPDEDYSTAFVAI